MDECVFAVRMFWTVDMDMAVALEEFRVWLTDDFGVAVVNELNVSVDAD